MWEIPIGVLPPAMAHPLCGSGRHILVLTPVGTAIPRTQVLVPPLILTWTVFWTAGTAVLVYLSEVSRGPTWVALKLGARGLIFTR